METKMSDLIENMDFDYGDLPAEKVLECETAFQSACAIENQAVVMIGEQFAKVKENLRFLRNGNGFREWCDKRAKISHKTAYNYINAFENRESVKNLHTFGKSALFMLTAPTMPQEVRDQASELAEAGEDVSVKIIKQLKAEYAAKQYEVEEEKRRAQEFREESNERRKKIRELEQQLDLAERAEPEIKVVEKIPDDYEVAKRQAAELQAQTDALQKQLADLQKQQNKLVNDQVKTKLQGYQSELNKLEEDKRVIEEIVSRKKAYLDSLSGEVKRIETHQSVINGARMELIGLAAFLNDIEPISDPDTIKKWLALADMHEEAMKAIRSVFGEHGLLLRSAP
jgi:DNA repair exonuclease SbcCD ATPase subunit